MKGENIFPLLMLGEVHHRTVDPAEAYCFIPEPLVRLTKMVLVHAYRVVREALRECCFVIQYGWTMVQVLTDRCLAKSVVILREEDVGMPEGVNLLAHGKPLVGTQRTECYVSLVFDLDSVDFLFRVDTVVHHVLLDDGQIPRVYHAHNSFLTPEKSTYRTYHDLFSIEKASPK